MRTDDLSRFLHTDTWEDFLGSTGATVERNFDDVWVKGTLPSGGEYWRGSRIFIDAKWAPPAFTKNAWFLRIEPVNEAHDILETFGELRPTDSVQPKQTMVLDLKHTEDHLLASMKSKHRYNIRLAEKHGVQVEHFHLDAPEHFERFWKLLQETAERHTFKTHSKGHYKKMVDALAPKGLAHLGFATYEGHDVAAILLVNHEHVLTYLHGGSTQAHRQVMAPFLLHWKTITWAKQEGFTTYDFWGTNAVKKDGEWTHREHHPSAGTTRFKLGFGGKVISYPGAFDLVLKPFPYTLYSAFRRIIRRQSSF